MNLWRQVLRTIRRIIAREISVEFSTPIPVDIVVIDAEVEERLRVSVLSGCSYTTVYTRAVSGKFIINLSPRIVLLSIYYLATQSARSVSLCYLWAIFKTTKPSVIIENTHIAQLARLASVCSKIQFFVVLNGYWLNIRNGLYGSDELYHKQLARTVKSLDCKIENYHIYTFGLKDVEIFEDEGLETARSGIRYHPVGSMMGDAYRAMYGCQKIGFDIVWISQCSSETLRGSSEIQNLLREQTAIAASLISRYVKKKCLSLLIQLRSPLDDECLEKEFYCNLFEGLPISVEFSRNLDVFSAYSAVSKASLVASIHSTLGYESMSWGKRVIFFHLDFSTILKVSSSKHDDDAEIWPWIVVDKNYDAFEAKIEKLKMLNDSSYLEESAPYISYLMGDMKKKDAHQIIREDIAKTLREK